MQRNEFKFQYNGSILQEACEAKVSYHKARLEWWIEESDKAEKKLKTATVEFREFEQTGGKQVQAVIDPTLSQRFSQCQSKINGHTQKIEEYDRWARGFEANSVFKFSLDPDDIAYFGL